MPTTLDALIVDLLDWIGPEPRSDIEVIEAWRTSCPRLRVWEAANERGFIVRSHSKGSGACVCVSDLGRGFPAHTTRTRQAQKTSCFLLQIKKLALPMA